MHLAAGEDAVARAQVLVQLGGGDFLRPAPRAARRRGWRRPRSCAGPRADGSSRRRTSCRGSAPGAAARSRARSRGRPCGCSGGSRGASALELRRQRRRNARRGALRRSGWKMRMRFSMSFHGRLTARMARKRSCRRPDVRLEEPGCSSARSGHAQQRVRLTGVEHRPGSS